MRPIPGAELDAGHDQWGGAGQRDRAKGLPSAGAEILADIEIDPVNLEHSGHRG